MANKVARLTEDCLAKTADTVYEVKEPSAMIYPLLADSCAHTQLIADMKSEVNEPPFKKHSPMH